jgi:hypothetical protein
MRRRLLMLSFSLTRERHRLEARVVSLPSVLLSLLAEPRLPPFRAWTEVMVFARARGPWHAETDLLVGAVWRAWRHCERRCRARLFNYSLESAAEVVGLSVEAAKKRIARAERRLGRSFKLEKILKNMSPAVA